MRYILILLILFSITGCSSKSSDILKDDLIKIVLNSFETGYITGRRTECNVEYATGLYLRSLKEEITPDEFRELITKESER